MPAGCNPEPVSGGIDEEQLLVDTDRKDGPMPNR
jgi:hypothetical protein